MFNAIRASLKFKDEWKISYRDTFEKAYKSLWRLLVKQGEDNEALIVADQGRARVLNDLVNFTYGSGEAYYRHEHPEKAACELLVGYRASNTVFVAVAEGEFFSGLFSSVKMFSLE